MRIGKDPKKFAFICDNLWDVEDPNDPKVYPAPNQLYRLMDKQQCYMWVGYKDGNDRVHIMPLGAMVLTNSHLYLPLDDDRLFGLYLTDENSGIQARVREALDECGIIRWKNEATTDTLYLVTRKQLERKGITKESLNPFMYSYPDEFVYPLNEKAATTEPTEVIKESTDKGSPCLSPEVTKQTFIEMFEKAQNFFKQQHELGQMLHKTLLNGGSVVSFGGELLEGYVKLLAEQSGISQDSIEWLLYEGGGRCFKDKVSYSVITAEDLWEFEKEVMYDDGPKM